MGTSEIIYPDGSGIEFTDTAITAQHYVRCDSCNKMTKLSDIRNYLVGAEYVAIWICKECNKVK